MNLNRKERRMANKVIKHYYDEPTDTRFNLEPDKTKSISELSLPELRRMLERLRSEREVEDTIRDLKRRSGERDTYEEPFKIDTMTPINQLYHYGILGQKWGVRRFQNKDGTRTPAGKRRDEISEKSEDHVKSRDSKSKAPSGLSNEELKKLNERLQLEETYKKLTTEKIERGESFVKKAIVKGAGEALSEFSKGVFLGSAKILVQQMAPQFAEDAFGMKPKDKK
jgi:hypothetical protein